MEYLKTRKREEQPATQRATSSAFRGRSIGRADGPDRASRGHFSKKPFYFSEINPRSRVPLRIFCKKLLRFFWNQPAVQKPSHRFLRKPPQIFLKLIYSPTLIIPFFPKKNVWPLDRAHGRARKTSIHINHNRTAQNRIALSLRYVSWDNMYRTFLWCCLVTIIDRQTIVPLFQFPTLNAVWQCRL